MICSAIKKILSCLPKGATLIEWSFTEEGCKHYLQYDRRVKFVYKMPDGRVLTANISAQSGGFK